MSKTDLRPITNSGKKEKKHNRRIGRDGCKYLS